jgi:hypothetical protein
VKKNRSTTGLLLILSFSLFTVMVPFTLAAEDMWVTREPMQQAREGLGVAVVDGRIYAIGGYARGLPSGYRHLGTNEEYDPATDMWTYRAPMPTPRSRFGIAVVDNKIYCIGGWTDDNETAVNEVYDPQTDTWENRTSIPTPRADMTANTVDGKIYVIGGYPSTNVNEVYDTETDTWTTETSIPNAVSSYASAVVDDKIYILGGHDLSLGVDRALTQIYDPQTGNWSLGDQLQYRVYYAAAGATTGVMAPERIYVLGGTGAGVPKGTNQIYDPENDIWTIGTPLPTSRINLAVAVINDTIYALGGDHWPVIGPTASSAINEQYTPAGYIPEFPSWIILPLFLFATLVVVGIKRKVFRPT